MKLYKNIRIFTMDEQDNWYENGYIMIKKGKIAQIGSCSDLTLEEESGYEIIDGKNATVIPGMVTTHAHFYGQFARGMSVSEPISNWQQVLSRMWWKFDKKLTEKQVYYSTIMGLIDGVKSGTTTYFDHQASPCAIDGCLDIVEQAVRQVGARACLSYEVTDRDGMEKRNQGIAENVRFIKKMQDSQEGLIQGLFGMHAGYTISEETLGICADYGKQLNTGFHIHVAESMADVAESYKTYDMHVVERLARGGILGDKTIAAHGVHTRKSEWEILKDTQTTVVHNVQSNTNNAVGVCPVVQMLENGVSVALGGDGYTYDLFHELSFATIMQRLLENHTGVFDSNQIKAFTYGNSSALAKRVLGVETGVLKEGAVADFLMVDYVEPTPMNGSNIFSHMMSAFSGKVKNVIIAGKEVVKDGICVNIDEERLLAKCCEEAESLWKSL